MAGVASESLCDPLEQHHRLQSTRVQQTCNNLTLILCDFMQPRPFHCSVSALGLIVEYEIHFYVLCHTEVFV